MEVLLHRRMRRGRGQGARLCSPPPKKKKKKKKLPMYLIQANFRYSRIRAITIRARPFFFIRAKLAKMCAPPPPPNEQIPYACMCSYDADPVLCAQVTTCMGMMGYSADQEFKFLHVLFARISFCTLSEM